MTIKEYLIKRVIEMYEQYEEALKEDDVKVEREVDIIIQILKFDAKYFDENRELTEITKYMIEKQMKLMYKSLDIYMREKEITE